MQSLTDAAAVDVPSEDGLVGDRLVLLGDGRQIDDLPALAAQAEHMADEVVLVQPLHDDDLAHGGRVVAAGKEGGCDRPRWWRGGSTPRGFRRPFADRRK